MDESDSGKTIARPDVQAAKSDSQQTLVRGEDAAATVVRDEDSTLVRSHPDATPTVLHAGAGAADDGPVTPETPGRYDVRSEYGRGGQSRVLLAFDQHVGREIALKELLPEGVEPEGGTPRSASQAASSRFVREARITGQLEHPNIVPVYELGRHPDGTLYYTQKLVRGVTLRARLAEARTMAGRLALLSHFSDICHAVAYAHSRGVVHRDLKPENVMIGQFGETVVLDWGLAKARGQKDVRAKEMAREAELMRSPDATLAGHALGTPSYMSPEQAQGKLEEIDERSDVWSLGAILFEILTGRPPYGGDTAYSVIRKVIDEAPPKVREVIKDAPPELAAVAERALQRDRAARYASAEEVAKEVEAYQTGGDVRAYRYSSWELLWRFVQKHRALTAVSGLALLLLIAALVVIHDESKRARAALSEAKRNLAQAFLEKAHGAEREFFWHKAEIFYAAARVQEDSPQARWGSVIEGEDASGVTRIAGPDGWVVTAAFFPDGKAVAAAGMDATARVFDLSTGREQWRFTAPEPIKDVAVSPDGSAIASRDISGLVRLHARDSGALLGSVACRSSGKGPLAFSGGRLIVSCPEGTRWLDPRAGKSGVLPFGSARVAECGGRILYSNEDAVRIDGGPAFAVPAGKHEIACAGGLVAISAGDDAIHLFDASGRARGVLSGHSERVSHVAVSADGARVASAALDRTVRLWDAKSLRPLATLPRPAPPVWVEFSPDGQQIAVGEQQNALLLWDVSSEQRGVSGSFTDFLFLPGGGYVAGGSAGVIGRWGKDGRLLASMREGDAVVDLALDPRGERLAVLGASGTVSAWGLTSYRLQSRFRLQTPARGALFLPDGSLLLRTGRALAVRDAATGHELRALPAAEAPIESWVATSDGRLLFLRDEQGQVSRVDLASGKALPRPPLQASSIALSADGKTLAAGSAGRIALLDAATLARKGELKMEGAAPISLAFSPDGKLLAASGQDGAAHLYELEGGGEVAHLPVAGSTSVGGLQFSWDGSLLHLLVAGSTSALGGVRFLHLGSPASLPAPQEALRQVLDDHGVVLAGGEIEPRPPPVTAAVSGPAPAQ